MKRKLLCALAVLALVLEALPWSAALTLAEKGESKRFYYSSFDPTPFIDRHFGPLLAAVATCVLFLATLVYLAGGKGLSFLQVVSGAAFLFSLLPFLHASERVTILGAGVSCALLAAAAISFLPLPDGLDNKKKKRKGKRS